LRSGAFLLRRAQPPRRNTQEEVAMFTLSEGVSDLILRALIVYFFVFALLRLLGKKHVSQMAPFDLVVLLILSESVQNAIIGEDKSLIGGLIASATIVGATALVGYATWRSKTLAHFFEGQPRILVRNGRVLKDVLAREQITRAELLEALRRSGCSSLTRVRYAILENDGDINIGLRAKRRR
jgi:uncharacterized membrane protein YcaP (DUF421 family)